jgi:hypothetical protein
MKKSLKFVLKTLAIGIGFAVLGHVLTGCGGGGSTETEVIPPNEPKDLRCQVPSPTYEKTSMPLNGESVLSVVVSNAADAQLLCEAWTVITPAGVNPAGAPYPAGCKLVTMPTSPECSVTMTSDVCRNVSDDFVDSAGGRHCFHLTPQLDGHGVDACNMNTPSAAVRAGTQTCKLSGMGLMNPAKTDSRVVELCTPDGQFIGWQCPFDSLD